MVKQLLLSWRPAPTTLGAKLGEAFIPSKGATFYGATTRGLFLPVTETCCGMSRAGDDNRLFCIGFELWCGSLEITTARFHGLDTWGHGWI